jgi:hypothetical protein
LLNWRQIKSFPGVPANTYVSDIHPDRFDENIVYVSFNNHQRDDFKPYLLKSTDKGKSWISIAGNLPENGPVLTIQQDVVKRELLFAGTEFGVFFSIDGGGEWVPLKSGLPSVAVKDMVIQERENDLVIATFGRGFYILDDYTPLRYFDRSILEKEAYIFPVRDAKMYIQTGGKYGQGATLYASDNPEFGAAVTYYLKEAPKSIREQRLEEEKTLFKDKKPIPQPTLEELRAEQNEEPSYLLFTVYDQDKNAVRKITAKPSEGINRITWDLRYDHPGQTVDNVGKFDPFASRRSGMLAMPGTYSIGMHMSVNGMLKEIHDPVELKADVLRITTLPAPSRDELVAFQQKVSRLIIDMTAAEKTAGELLARIRQIRQTLLFMPGAPEELMTRARTMELSLDEVLFTLNGREARASSEELPPGPVPLNERMRAIVYTHWSSTSAVTQTQKDNYQIVSDEYPRLYEKIRNLSEEVISLGKELDQMGAPWTPGRLNFPH